MGFRGAVGRAIRRKDPPPSDRSLTKEYWVEVAGGSVDKSGQYWLARAAKSA